MITLKTKHAQQRINNEQHTKAATTTTARYNYDNIDNSDNNVDEDPASDMNNDGCPGICGVDAISGLLDPVRLIGGM